MELDAERQKRARGYARIRRRLSFVNIGIAVIGVIIIFCTGLDWRLRDWLHPFIWQPVAGWFPIQLGLYFLVLLLSYEILISPLSYYAGFILPRQYGLSVQSFKGWFLDLMKGLALGLVLEILAIEVIYVLLATQPHFWWLWVALAWLRFTVVMVNLAPILLFPIFYKFTPLSEGELTQRLLVLAENAKTRIQGVFSMQMSRKTTAANAALMGLGNTRRIVIADTMLDRYTTDEIEVVLAHELGHQVHYDIWKLIVWQSILTLAGLYLTNLALYWAVDTQHFYRGLADPATIPLILTLASVFGLIAMPLSNGLSRAIEYHADEYALQATHKVEAFKSAMTRLANQNLAEVEPSPIIEFLFHNHPSIKKRLEHADEFASRTGHASNIALSTDG